MKIQAACREFFVLHLHAAIERQVVSGYLDSYLDTTASTYTTVLKQVRDAVPDTKSIIVQYLDTDGDVIVEKEFK